MYTIEIRKLVQAGSSIRVYEWVDAELLLEFSSRTDAEDYIARQQSNPYSRFIDARVVERL